MGGEARLLRRRNGTWMASAMGDKADVSFGRWMKKSTAHAVGIFHVLVIGCVDRMVQIQTYSDTI